MAHTIALPPIQLLPAFEAAARHMSFKAAARELRVTPSAISQQLKALEDALGLVLFDRQPRSVTLTEAGALYLEVARDTLETFRRGTARARDRFRRRVLRLNTDAAIAHDVLIPSLPSFEQAHAELDLRLETSSALIDLRVDAADAALRYGTGPWPGVVSELIASVVATPVGSRDLLRKQPLRKLRDLGKHTLLRVQSTPDHWQILAARVGFEIREQKTFDSYLATLHAAAHGVGVALGLFPVSTAWVRDGRLAAPCPERFEAAGYHLVCRAGEAQRAEMEQVKAWIQRCFAALPSLPAKPSATG